jgi:hypothetical protein
LREAADRNRRAAVAAGAADRAGGLAAFLGISPTSKATSPGPDTATTTRRIPLEHAPVPGIRPNVTWEAPDFSTGTSIREAVGQSDVQAMDTSGTPEQQDFWAMLGTPEAPHCIPAQGPEAQCPLQATDVPLPASGDTLSRQPAQPDLQPGQPPSVKGDLNPTDSKAPVHRQMWEGCLEPPEWAALPHLERKRKRLEAERAAHQAQLADIHAANWQQLRAAAAANKASVLQQLATVKEENAGAGEGVDTRGGASAGGHAWNVVPELQVAHSMATGVCVDGPDTPKEGQRGTGKDGPVLLGERDCCGDQVARMDIEISPLEKEVEKDSSMTTSDAVEKEQHVASEGEGANCLSGPGIPRSVQRGDAAGGAQQVAELQPAVMAASGVCVLGDTAPLNTLCLPSRNLSSAAASGLCIPDAESPTAKLVEKLPNCSISPVEGREMEVVTQEANSAAASNEVFAPGEATSVLHGATRRLVDHAMTNIPCVVGPAVGERLDGATKAISQALGGVGSENTCGQGCGTAATNKPQMDTLHTPSAAAAGASDSPEDDRDGQEFAALLQDMAQTVQEGSSSNSSSGRGTEQDASYSCRDGSCDLQEGHRIASAQADKAPFCPHHLDVDASFGGHGVTSLGQASEVHEGGLGQGQDAIRSGRMEFAACPCPPSAGVCDNQQQSTSSGMADAYSNSCRSSEKASQRSRIPPAATFNGNLHSRVLEPGTFGEASSAGQCMLGGKQVCSY